MNTTILINRELTPGYFHLVVSAPEIAANSRPGQFVMMKLSHTTYDPLLRRPISIMQCHRDGRVEFLFKVVGRGTGIIARMTPGTELDILGPLGNGFQIDPASGEAILAGGGIGIPPLIFLADQLRKERDVRIQVFLGGKSRSDLPLLERFSAMDLTPVISTDDGTLGHHGLLSEPLSLTLKKQVSDSTSMIYACGPRGMLKAVSDLSQQFGVPAQLSLENHMGCGVGACLGCITQTVHGPRTVCNDGPVFIASELIWS